MSSTRNFHEFIAKGKIQLNNRITTEVILLQNLKNESQTKMEAMIQKVILKFDDFLNNFKNELINEKEKIYNDLDEIIENIEKQKDCTEFDNDIETLIRIMDNPNTQNKNFINTEEWNSLYKIKIEKMDFSILF